MPEVRFLLPRRTRGLRGADVLLALQNEVRRHPGCLVRLGRLWRAQQALTQGAEPGEALTGALHEPLDLPRTPLFAQTPSPVDLRLSLSQQGRLQALRARQGTFQAPEPPEEARIG